MEQYSLSEAQTQLDKLITDARDGKTVIIMQDEHTGVQLIPISDNLPRIRQAGSVRGKFWMSDDFDELLDDFREYR